VTTSVQICFGASSGGSLFAGGFEPVLAFNLTFDGRFQDFKTYEEYETTSQTFLQGISQYSKIVDGFDVGIAPLFSYKKDHNPPVSVTGDEFINITKEADDVIVWLSLGFHEHLLLAFLIRLFTRYSLPLEKIKVRRMETYLFNGRHEKILSIGMVSPAGLKEAVAPTPLQQVEIDLLTQGWEAITSSNPQKMEAYLNITPTTHFQEGMRDFQGRFPSSKSGLNCCQTELLEVYPSDQASVNANWLVGTVIGRNFSRESLDIFFDGYVIWNLMQLTNLHSPRPAFVITNPYTREHHVSLTDFGRALLKGNGNWMDENPVDYHVGGIHVNHTP
jgi:hypothetical protein